MEEITKNNTDELSEENVWDILSFANALNGMGIYGNAYSPLLLNQRLKDLNLSPQAATEQALNDALAHPKDSENALQEFGNSFEITSQVYKRLLSYLANMLSWDMTFECINAKPEDYSGKSYQRDKDKISEFFDKFDYRKEFSIAVGEMLRNEIFACLPRWDMKDQFCLQEIPSSPTYTMITGKFDWGLLFSLNMFWFMLPGVDLNLYPTFFKRKYNELWGGSDSKFPTYNPALSPLDRGNSSWTYWQDIPVDIGWIFKMSPALSARVPYFSGLFLDLINQNTMRSLQKNINMSTAARLIIGEVGTLKDAQAKVKDQFSISPALLGAFLALVKSAIGDSLKTAALPLTNVQGINFPAENDLYSSYLKTSLATSGINTNLLFSSETKMNSVETQLSLNVDEELMYSLYPQFEAFLNYNVNRFTSKFKFRFHFQGTKFFNNRQQRLDAQMALSPLGIVLPQQIAASIGLNIFELERQLEESKATGFDKKLLPLVSAFQQKAGGAEAGRPQKSSSELGDAGSDTRDSASNVEKGGEL